MLHRSIGFVARQSFLHRGTSASRILVSPRMCGRYQNGALRHRNASSGRSPATRWARRRKKGELPSRDTRRSDVKNIDGASFARALTENNEVNNKIGRGVRTIKNEGLIDVDIETALRFLRNAAEILDNGKDIDNKVLESLKTHAISLGDASDLSVVLINCMSTTSVTGRFELRMMGQELLCILSLAGDIASSMRFVSHDLHNDDPEVKLPSARDHVKSLASSGEYYQAMVLEALCLEREGDQGDAIDLLGKALPLAEEALPLSEIQDRTAARLTREWPNLSAPWHDLYAMHLSRKDLFAAREDMQKVIEIGCRQDDPLSHYLAAAMLTQTHRYGRCSRDWSYHMTKSAASGHAPACYELGMFYATDGRTHDEDVVSTEYRAHLPGRSTWFLEPFHRVRSSIRKFTRGMFRQAAFNLTGEERQHLAESWLLQAAERTYAPAHLALAEIYFDTRLWTPVADDPADPAARPKNPVYGTDLAQFHLSMFLFSELARQFKESSHEKRRKRMGVGRLAIASDELVEQGLADLDPVAAYWYRHREVREFYEPNADGRFVDPYMNADLHTKARDLLKTHQLDAAQICLRNYHVMSPGYKSVQQS